MKRTPLKRKKPLVRKAGLKRKTWMKRQSPRKLKEKLDTDHLREAYKSRATKCECCRKRKPDHCHEIASGGSRQKAVLNRCCYLAVCKFCHREIHDTIDNPWPLVRQLAAKKLADPDYYDRLRFLEIKHWANTAITEQEVDYWLPTIPRLPGAETQP